MKGLNAWAKRAHAFDMKNNQPKPIHDCNSSTQPSPQGNRCANAASRATSSSWGWMWTCSCVVTAIQCDRGTLALAQKFSRAQLLVPGCRSRSPPDTKCTRCTRRAALATRCTTRSVAAGAHSIVTTPMRLSPERRRKNDRLDARRTVRAALASSGWPRARVETHSHSHARRAGAARTGTAARVLQTRTAPAGEPRARFAHRVRA